MSLRVLDHAARVARCLVDIDDAAVGRVRGIELAYRNAVEPFIGAGRTEFGAPNERCTRGDLDCGDHAGFSSLPSLLLAMTRRRVQVTCSFASVRACNASKVSPAIMSRTTKPFGVTSSTARLV